MANSDSHEQLRSAARQVCRRFSDDYWRMLDQERAYPEGFVQAMTEAGFLAAMIPQEYGGLGLGLTETSIILEEVNRSGGNSGTAHAQIYTMGTLLRHGSDEQKQAYLPEIASSRPWRSTACTSWTIDVAGACAPWRPETQALPTPIGYPVPAHPPGHLWPPHGMLLDMGKRARQEPAPT